MELVGGQSKLRGNLRKFHYCITKFHFHIQNFESPKFYWLQQISYACKFETMWSTCGNVEVLPLWNTPIILGSLLLENFGKCNQLENSFPSRQSTFAAASVEVFYSNAPITPTSETGPSLCFISSTRLRDFLDWLITCCSSSSALSGQLRSCLTPGLVQCQCPPTIIV